MANFQKILVALDFTQIDKRLVQAADFFVTNLEAGSVEFIHVIPSFVKPKGLEDSYQNIFSPTHELEKVVEQKMREESSLVFNSQHRVQPTFSIKEGNAAKTVEKSAEESGADLLVVGRKKSSTHSGISAKAMARRVKSAVLFVAENSDLSFNHILVPIDFSAYSKKALETALWIQRVKPNTKITALHIIDFPPNAQYLTGHYGMLALDWQEKVDTMFNRFASHAGINVSSIQFESIKNESFNIALEIIEYASKISADAIILGAKGHSGIDDLFLGSVTEKLVNLEDDLPVLVVR